jgi:hypothetical protein
MACERPIDRAKAVRETGSHLTELARDQIADVQPQFDGGNRSLADLATELDMCEERVAALTTTLAARLDNLLMSIEIANDLLRTTPADEVTLARLRRQLDETVSSGRRSLKTLPDAVGQLQ